MQVFYITIMHDTVCTICFMINNSCDTKVPTDFTVISIEPIRHTFLYVQKCMPTINIRLVKHGWFHQSVLLYNTEATFTK